MTMPLLYLQVFVNNMKFKALIDSGSSCYATISKEKARGLPQHPIVSKQIGGVLRSSQFEVTHVANFNLKIHDREIRIFAYVIPGQHEDLLLGRPFLKDQKITLDEGQGIIKFPDAMIDVKKTKAKQFHRLVIQTLRNCKERETNQRIFAITAHDLEEALKEKVPLSQDEIRQRLPPTYHEFLDVFDPTEADKLPPHRPGIDHRISIEMENGIEKALPWGPLYGMSREQLLILRKTLNELLGKRFIRESNSDAAAPVLFVKKPGGGLRFCVDYRGLNAITRKDRYPLPLVKETRMALAKTRYLTKLDVIAAFHKIRVAAGDEPKTAFRTRYGLFEWLVTPFGLTGAPATFQRYINHILRDYLDDFCSAYIDDILVFSQTNETDHIEKVKAILQRCRDAKLYLDIKKCEFGVKSTKYLGIIIDTEQGLRMDPEKISAIEEWQEPKTVRAVRSFLGTANFYRDFIPNYSMITQPLTMLTKKKIPFTWGKAQQDAFNTIKTLFVNKPIIAPVHEDRSTRVEPDASGWACGAVLSQQDELLNWKPCAYFSERHTPAQCNYDIHDKELLAIVKALVHWKGELLSLEKPFVILSDHKNLEKFMVKRALTERQIRFAETLSQFNFKIQHQPGRLAVVPDSLSRREQDLPANIDDLRIAERSVTLLPPKLIHINVTHTNSITNPFDQDDLKALWDSALQRDENYAEIFEQVRQQERRFAPTLQLQVSIADCTIIDDTLYYRNRIWIPDYEPLRTTLIQMTHDSVLSGHPGREATTAILSRQFYWPCFAQDIRKFIRNCEVCGRATIWRDKKRGLLQPLPVPDRIWQQISVDFVTDLPSSNGSTTLCVITDRLSKGTILFPILSGKFTAENFAKCFIREYVRHHWLPKAIVSDRGSQFVNDLWKRVCQLLKVKRRLSTAYHPETDGSTERRNQEVEAYLRKFCTYAQTDWNDLLPMAQIALDNRPNQRTGLSPFFLTHGYDLVPIQLVEPLPSGNTIQRKANNLVTKLKDAQDWAQTSMVLAQQEQEKYANRSRVATEAFRVGDKVWLNMKNIRTNRKSKKLDWLHHKFTITKIISGLVYELDTPPGIFNRFHATLLRRAAQDPLPSQINDNVEPPAVINEDGDKEFYVDEILAARWHKGKRQVLVKWTGLIRPDWQPLEELKDNIAVDAYESKYGDINNHDGMPLRQQPKKRKGGNVTG